MKIPSEATSEFRQKRWLIYKKDNDSRDPSVLPLLWLILVYKHLLNNICMKWLSPQAGISQAVLRWWRTLLTCSSTSWVSSLACCPSGCPPDLPHTSSITAGIGQVHCSHRSASPQKLRHKQFNSLCSFCSVFYLRAYFYLQFLASFRQCNIKKKKRLVPFRDMYTLPRVSTILKAYW